MLKEQKNNIKEKNKKIYKQLHIARCAVERTFDEMGKDLGVTTSTVFKKFKNLKNGKSVKTEFLFEMEEYFGIKIFFEL